MQQQAVQVIPIIYVETDTSFFCSELPLVYVRRRRYVWCEKGTCNRYIQEGQILQHIKVCPGLAVAIPILFSDFAFQLSLF